jgi:hypothetical protein
MGEAKEGNPETDWDRVPLDAGVLECKVQPRAEVLFALLTVALESYVSR